MARVISIFLASEISCCRVSKGISPICVRYMRHRVVRPAFQVRFFGHQLVGFAVDVELGHRRLVGRQQIVVIGIVHIHRLIDQLHRFVSVWRYVVFQIVEQ